jgi:hypothetical protein
MKVKEVEIMIDYVKYDLENSSSVSIRPQRTSIESSRVGTGFDGFKF